MEQAQNKHFSFDRYKKICVSELCPVVIFIMKIVKQITPT